MQENQYAFDPVREDLDTVSTDLRQRRACRHTMFIAIVGGMATSGFALIALIQQSGGPNQWHKWILVGMTIPLLILLVGVTTAINKARAINIRSGYLAAVAYYVHNGKKMPYFGGWLNALRAARICANLTFADANDMTPCGRRDGDDCVAEAKKEAEWINRTIQTWRREIVKSFTVMTAMIYGLLSIAAGVAVTTSTIKLINSGETASSLRVLVGVITFAVPILGALLTLFGNSRSVQSIRIILCYGMMVLGGSAISGAAMYRLFPDGERSEWISVFGLGGGFLFIASLGILLFDQIYRVRKGDYSFETYYHLWRLRFERCPLMTGRYIYREGRRPGIGTYRCLRCPEGGQEITNGGKALVECDVCGNSYFGEIEANNNRPSKTSDRPSEK